MTTDHPTKVVEQEAGFAIPADYAPSPTRVSSFKATSLKYLKRLTNKEWNDLNTDLDENVKTYLEFQIELMKDQNVPLDDIITHFTETVYEEIIKRYPVPDPRDKKDKKGYRARVPKALCDLKAKLRSLRKTFRFKKRRNYDLKRITKAINYTLRQIQVARRDFAQSEQSKLQKHKMKIFYQNPWEYTKNLVNPKDTEKPSFDTEYAKRFYGEKFRSLGVWADEKRRPAWIKKQRDPVPKIGSQDLRITKTNVLRILKKKKMWSAAGPDKIMRSGENVPVFWGYSVICSVGLKPIIRRVGKKAI